MTRSRLGDGIITVVSFLKSERDGDGCRSMESGGGVWDDDAVPIKKNNIV
jgi:hypothetical protein